MVDVAGEPRVLQAQGVEMAFDLGEALLHDLAQHHRKAVAEKACQPELQEHRQLEQDYAVDKKGLQALRQIGGERPAEDQVRIERAVEAEPPGRAVRTPDGAQAAAAAVRAGAVKQSRLDGPRKWH